MKIFKLLIIMLACSFAGCSPLISVDRIENDGSRQVMTKTEPFYIGKRVHGIGLKVFIKAGNEDWVLVISSDQPSFNTGAVLLKLGNDEILHLPTNNACTHTGRHYHTTHYGSESITIPEETYHYSSVYVLTETDLDKIERHGITKIRFFDGVKFRERTYSNENIANFLISCRKKIKKRIQTSPKPEELFDNF